MKQTLDTIGPLVVTLLAGAAAWAVAKMPLYIRAFVGTKLTEQLLSRAVDYAFNVVTDATKGEKVNIDTGNRVVKAGLDHAIAHSSDWLKQFMGEDRIREKIIARLDTAKGTALR